ncbi:hypothetical protein BD769DRAFT_1684362 [Suillus cothurnatus]|nr:hypothetical protein BD769DRAFT_1684362 [Suillus cothurnatus]
MTELQPTPAINIHLVIHNNQTIEACILQQKHAQPTTRLALALTHKTHVLIHRILATPKTTHDHLTPALLIRGTTHVRPTQRKMQELTKTRAIRIPRGRIQLINEATRLALRSRELTRIRVIRLRTAVQPMTRVYSDGRAYPQESRTYVPPPQPAPPQPQTQDTRYTPTQESRNTYPPPAPSYPPAQDTRPYAPPPPVERTYSQSHTETRGYPVERQQQQLSYDAQQGRTSSALEPQPQSQLPHSQPPREQRGSTSNDRNLGVVEPRAVEVRPTLLQRQSVGDTRPLTVETRGVGLETQVRMETQSRAVGVESQRPPAFESQRSAAFESQRPAAFESQRPAAFESQRTPAFESQRPSAFESQVRGSGVETQTQTQSRQAVFEPQQRQSNLETQGRPPVFETQTRPTTFESQARPAFEPQRQTMLEPQPRSTVIESQTRPTPFEAQPRTAVLESQARPPMMLEGPARSTGFISQLQSQSQSQSQGSQRVAGDDRLGKEDVVREIVQHCTALYKFADHYSILQSSNPHVQPSAEELAEMTARAGEVVRLLEALRNDAPIFPSSLLSASAFTSTSGSHALVSVHPHSSEAAVKGYMTSSSSLGLGIMDVDAPDRAPKRPWEDVEGMLPPGSGPGIAPSSSGAGHVHVPIVSTPGLGTAQISGTAMAAGVVQDQDRSMAEADMELIRTKRALTTMAAAAALGGNGTGGSGGKNKYRKRSRATPPGKCHSCNIRETPEWRRGPDDYAKLVRKREKALANGESPSIQRIDMEMLRASARAADADKGARAALGGAGSAGGAVMSSVGGHGSGSGTGSGGGSGGGDDKMNLGIHQGSFQINTDPGDAMQDQDLNLNSQSSAGGSGSGSGSGTYARPPRPSNSKRPSSARVVQSPGIGVGMGGQHPSAGVSHHPAGQTPSMSHHTTPSGSHLSTPSAHHQTSSTHHQTSSAQHHQTPSAHHQTPVVPHHQTPSIPHHTTPSMTHQTANSSSGSTSRHPPAASHTPVAQPASQGHHQSTAQGHHQSASTQGHHQTTSTQGHHQSTSTQAHHQSASAQGHHQPTAQGHHQSASTQGHHQSHHPPSRAGPPPPPPWYMPATNQSHSMLRQ